MRFSKSALAFFVLLTTTCFQVRADDDVPPPLPSANSLVQAVLDRRPTGDFHLKATLYRLEGIDGKRELGKVEILSHRSATDTRTVVRALEPASVAGTTILIIQPETGAPHFYLAAKGKETVELPGDRLKESFIGSDFSYEDLNLTFFLFWPKRTVLNKDTVRGQSCYKLEFKAPEDSTSQYARVLCWIDKAHYAVLKTMAYDADGREVRWFGLAALKKIKSNQGHDLWLPKALEMYWRTPNQALPDLQKTRMEITDGEYELTLPEKLFAPESFNASN